METKPSFARYASLGPIFHSRSPPGSGARKIHFPPMVLVYSTAALVHILSGLISLNIALCFGSDHGLHLHTCCGNERIPIACSLSQAALGPKYTFPRQTEVKSFPVVFV